VSAPPLAKKTAGLIEKETEVSYEQLRNFKSQIPNTKQITMTEIQNPKQLAFDLN